MNNLFIVIALLYAALTSTSVAESNSTTTGCAGLKTGDKIAFLGDSITAQGFDNAGGYVWLVISGLESLGLKVTPIPAGVSGHTSKDMLVRLSKDVIAKKPDWVTISCGVNDVWHGAMGVELAAYKANLKAMVDQCQAAGIRVMLLTATMIGEDQSNANNQKLVAYNEAVRILAQEKKCLLADLNARMQVAVKSPERSDLVDQGKKLTVDGVHMNYFGNEMMAEGVLIAFGFTDDQLKIARNKWADLANTMNLGTMAVSYREYKALEAAAAKRKQSVKGMVDAAVAKTLADLSKD